MRTDAEPIRSGSGQREGELASFARLRLDVDHATMCCQDLSADRQAEFNPQSERLTNGAVRPWLAQKESMTVFDRARTSAQTGSAWTAPEERRRPA